MYYITVRMPPYYRQMTLEELFLDKDFLPVTVNRNETCTRTYEREEVPVKFKKMVDKYHLVFTLYTFNKTYEHLFANERHSMYKTFYIPKKTRGFRRIDAPEDELKAALSRLKNILEGDFNALYHTSAFAYIKGRSTVSCVKKHQQNKSKWFGKYDLSNFFGSTTLEFVMKMLEKIYPFSEVMKCEFHNLITGEVMSGREELEKALSLGFLDGGLPQGTPLSPTLTNIMMIPIDFRLANKLRDYDNNYYVYTRYADDFIVSSKYSFDFRKIESLIKETLAEFDAPFTIKSEKTRYGSSAGANWNLGVMLNKDNDITVGHKRKKYLKNALSSFINDYKNNEIWDIESVNVLLGHYSYCHMVEPKSTDELINWINKKNNIDVIRRLNDLKSARI